MKDRERAFKVAREQVGIKQWQLPGRKQSFVNHSARGQRREVNAFAEFGFSPFAEEEELQLEIAWAVRGQKTLPNRGQSLGGTRAGHGGVDRDLAPSQKRQAHFRSQRFNRTSYASRFLYRQEQHAQPERTRQSDPQQFGRAANKSLWDRREQAGAVAAGGFITLLKTLPTIISSFKESLAALRHRHERTTARTERDLPITVEKLL